jgi:hypothetical protein
MGYYTSSIMERLDGFKVRVIPEGVSQTMYTSGLNFPSRLKMCQFMPVLQYNGSAFKPGDNNNHRKKLLAGG